MHAHSIKDLLDLPELFVLSAEKRDGQIWIEAHPVASRQACPICASSKTIRRGMGSMRNVRHLDAFACTVYLKLPAIRLYCPACCAHFVWSYECVGPKKRYTNAFEAALPKQVVGQPLRIQHV